MKRQRGCLGVFWRSKKKFLPYSSVQEIGTEQATNLGRHPDILLQQAVRAKINSSVNQLRHGSKVLEKLIQEDELLIVGAEYSLETGVVDFFDEPP